MFSNFIKYDDILKKENIIDNKENNARKKISFADLINEPRKRKVTLKSEKDINVKGEKQKKSSNNYENNLNNLSRISIHSANVINKIINSNSSEESNNKKNSKNLEIIPTNLNNNDKKEEDKTDTKNQIKLCANCPKKAKYRCNLCKTFYQCENPSIHKNDWEKHIIFCPKVIELKGDESPLFDRLTKQDLNFSSFIKQRKSSVNKKKKNSNKNKDDIENYKLFLIKYQSQYNTERKNIMIYINKKRYIDALKESNILIEKNVKDLLKNLETYKIINMNTIDKLNKFIIEDLIQSYLYYEEYFSNILLSILIYSLIKSRDKVERTLSRLLSELDFYKFNLLTEHIILYMLQKEKEKEKNSKLKKIAKEIYFKSLKINVCIAKYANILDDYYLYENYLLNFISKIQIVFYGSNYILSNTYLLLANSYLDIFDLKKSLLLYEIIIHKCYNIKNKKSHLTDVLLCALYNSGLVYFVIGQNEKSKYYLDNYLKIKLEILKNNSDFSIASTNEIIAEVEIQSKNYDSAYNYLNNSVEILNKICNENNENNNNIEIEILRNKIEILLTFIETTLNQEKNSNNEENNDEKNNNNITNINYNNFNNNISIMINNSKILNNSLANNMNATFIQNQIKKKFKIEDAEDDKILSEFLEEEFKPNNEREYNIDLLKTFYLFISSLNEKQINKLNYDQPLDYEHNKKLPLVFTKEFKEQLNHKQRYFFCQLTLSNLSRIKVLKDYKKPIKLKNLNYNLLYSEEDSKIIDNINREVLTNKMIEKWEMEKIEDSEYKKEKIDWNKKIAKEKEKLEELKKLKAYQKSNKNKEKFSKNYLERMSEEIFKNNDIIDYDKFKFFIKDYIKDKFPEKEKFVDENFILLLTRQMEKNNLKKIILNPETLIDIIESYQQFINESVENIKENNNKENNNNNNKNNSFIENSLEDSIIIKQKNNLKKITFK